jgi:hypothetical protein
MISPKKKKKFLTLKIILIIVYFQDVDVNSLNGMLGVLAQPPLEVVSKSVFVTGE